LTVSKDPPGDAYRAYPMSAVVVQDTQSLTTTVTVTTLAKAADCRMLIEALDPLNWKEFSDAFREVQYVEEGAQGWEPVATPPAPGDWSAPGENGGRIDRDLLLRELVKVPSGLSPTVVAEFENILRITLHESPEDEPELLPDRNVVAAKLTYSLFRSLNSRYLWDERPGGILLDQGFIKVRPLGKDGQTWRVTIRKVLRFADRTPSSWDDTPLQFGESLNYLTPAALSWWLQSDMYAAARYAQREADNPGEEPSQ
jgi:hypothetical protein